MQCKHAIQYGHALVVRAIVGAVEDEAFDEQDNKERTTLHLAAIRGILCASKILACVCSHIRSNWQYTKQQNQTK